MKQLVNKQVLIAAVVAGAFAAPAMADVTIYGFISGSVESVKATGATNPAQDVKSTARVSDENSRIGFKGNEDLGNGLKAIWQVESSLRHFENGGVDEKGNTATFATRNSFVGLESADFGKAFLGYNDTAYKVLTDVGENIAVNTTADVHGSTAIFSRGETRLKNSIHYFSPNFSGFTAGVSYGVDETRANDASGARTDAQRLSIAGNYTMSGLQVAAGWDRQYDRGGYGAASTLANGKNTDFYKLAASYKFTTGTYVGAGYEWGRFDSVTGGSEQKQDAWTVAVGQDFGASSIKLSYSQLGSLKNATSGSEDDYKAKQWVLAGTHDLSKRTQLYAYATKITNNKAQNVNFGVSPLATVGAGADPQAFGVGMKHNF